MIREANMTECRTHNGDHFGPEIEQRLLFLCVFYYISTSLFLPPIHKYTTTLSLFSLAISLVFCVHGMLYLLSPLALAVPKKKDYYYLLGLRLLLRFPLYFFLPFNASAAFLTAAASAFCFALKAKSSSVSSLPAFLGAFRGLALPPSLPGCR